MTEESINIGEAELEIMKVLWETEKPVNTQQISAAVEEKGWKRTTISTFLTRLVQKGAVSSEKRGKLYYYAPIVSKKEYQHRQTGNLIRSLFNGSVKDFAVSFFKDEKLSEADIKELKALIAEMEE